MPVVGHAAAPNMSSALALAASNTAVARRQINGHDVTSCIAHPGTR
ncbi:hypothetical protein [Arcanobacterium phocae]|nr:hypothetical protein [Arcanobacterium phocae]